MHSGRPRQRRRSRAESTSSGFCFGRRHRSSAEPRQPSRVCSCTRGARLCWNPRPRHKLLNRQCWKIYISIKPSQTWVMPRPLLIYNIYILSYLRINSTTLVLPFMAAKWSGVCSSSFLLSMSAPASRSSRTQSTLPILEATWIGRLSY